MCSEVNYNRGEDTVRGVALTHIYHRKINGHDHFEFNDRYTAENGEVVHLQIRWSKRKNGCNEKIFIKPPHLDKRLEALHKIGEWTPPYYIDNMVKDDSIVDKPFHEEHNIDWYIIKAGQIESLTATIKV